MPRRRFEAFWIAALFFAVPAVAVMFSFDRRAAADEEPQGRIVDVTDGDHDAAPAESDEDAAQSPADDEQNDAAAAYWIGLQGRPIDSPVLRTQFQLADDVGVVVENVVPESPADKAGLRQHDIIMAVNGEPVAGMEDLQQVVAGSQAKPLKLKVIRLAKETTVEVTPEERPQDLPGPASPMTPQDALGGHMDQLFRQFQPGEVPGGVRVFGPGMVLGGPAFNLNKLPAGFSISIARAGDEPPVITVKKGEQTWTVKGGDQRAVKGLPKEVRPFVQQMLAGSKAGPGGPHFNFGEFRFQNLPAELGQFDAQEAGKRINESNERLKEQIKQLERRMQQLENDLRPADKKSESEADPTDT
ncbi:MAG: PDZ domain-containing protein [Pirellulales bacterium]|nr:PDZ domain-containing protein [Pirellulales bacterium]